MSLILEALRKSEAERRRGESPDLLQSDATVAVQARTRLPPWAWLAAPLALLLLWWSLHGREASRPPTVAVEAVAVPSAPEPDRLPAISHLRPAPPERAPATPAPTPTPPAMPPIIAADAQPVALAAMPAEQRKALPPLRLSMHLWNEDPARRLAILDGRRVQEGDRIGDAIVAEITRDGVVLDWNGERVLVRLP